MNKKITVIIICMLFLITSNAFSLECFKESDHKEKKIQESPFNFDISPNMDTYNLVNTKSSKTSTDSYLINSEWGQHGYYKSKCPWTVARPPEQCRLGCWSVAIGQIINYHHTFYNLQSHGIVDYWCSELGIDPRHIVNNLNEYDYDWSKMIDKLVSTSSDAEKDNVSLLLFDTATVIQKDFGTGGYCTVNDIDNLTVLIDELIDHFEDITALTEWDIDLTESEIVYEIDYGRPIMFYTIGHNQTSGDPFGHAMVIDGYRYNDSSGRSKFEVHINYGWAGGNPDDLSDSWYYYYGYFPTYDSDLIFDEPSYRRGLLIRFAPKPPTLDGPSNGAIGLDYNYSASTIYDVNPPLYYKFDWDDGTSTDWLGRYNSGEECIASHSWKEKGVYNVKVKVKDVDGWESDWSDPLSVSMPKKKSISFNPRILLWLFERFPFLQSYLSYFL